MSLSLYDWQAADLATLRANNYTSLLNMEVGAGKTILATAAAKDSGADTVLIVGPESTFESAWKPTAGEFAGQEVRRVGNGNKAQRQTKDDLLWGRPGWYFITPQLLTREKEVENFSGDMLIVDEIHLLNSAKSKGQRVLSGYDIRKDNPISRRFDSRLALSGTPARNNFERMWATMRFLWPELDGMDQVSYFNYHAWLHARMDYVTVYTNQRDRQGNVVTAKKWLHEIEPGRLVSEAPCVIQHLRRERCCQFHPNGFLSLDEPQVLKRPVILLNEQKKAMNDLEEQMLAWLGDNPLVVDLPLTLHQRLRQVALGVPSVDSEGEVTFDPECKSPVVDEVLDIMDHLGNEENAVVYVDSQKFASVLTHRLNQAGVSAFEFSGKTTATRTADLAEFVSGRKYRVAVGTLSSLATGTDGLQKVASNELWVQRSLDETTNQQAMGRLDRMGQQRQQVQRWYIQDDRGMFEGQLSEALERRLMLNRSLKVAR